MRLFFLALLVLGYYFYLHDFQAKALSGLNNIKHSYEYAINAEVANSSLTNGLK